MTERFENWIGGEWVGSKELDPIVDPFGGGRRRDGAGIERRLERAIRAAEDAFEVTRGLSAWERERMLRGTPRESHAAGTRS